MPREYTKHREDMAERQAEKSRAGRDIGPIPMVVNPDRRLRCERSLLDFLTEYFPYRFPYPFSADHLTVIAMLEKVTREGGQVAIAMPRGFGKTTIIECAALWAALCGLHQYVVPLAATGKHAEGLLESIKTELEANDLLAEDFPEVCHPARSLESTARKAAGQLCEGKQTHIEWSKSEIVLPVVECHPEWSALTGRSRLSQSANTIVRCAGLDSAIRGMKKSGRDGRVMRPSLVLIDDPQTDESARSPSQCATRERLIGGSVMGMAGPGVAISALMAVTVIVPGDLADRLLDRDKHPEWRGIRTKMLPRMPENLELWERYRSIMQESLRERQDISLATEFYEQHRSEMDRGAEVAWPFAKQPDELTALQSAMNLYLTNPASFASERQNDPLPEHGGAFEVLTADVIANKLRGTARGIVPSECSRLTSFVDVQGRLLYWMVCAWADDFTGTIIDYGGYPDQGREYYGARDAPHTMASLHPDVPWETALSRSLTDLIARISTHDYHREGGGVFRVEQGLVDASWGESTDIVYEVVAKSPHAGVWMPSHGKGIGPESIPMADWKGKPGDRIGTNWRVPVATGTRPVRHVVYDTNAWKTFVHQRLRDERPSAGAMTLYGNRPHEHQMVADHIAAEYPNETTGRGRAVTVWKLHASGRDNHLGDAVVGCAVAASMRGSNLPGAPLIVPKKRRRLSIAEMRNRR